MHHIFDRIFVDWNTNFIEKIIIKTEKKLKPQALLITLPYLKFIPDYENLGFTLKSHSKITQTALLTEISFPNYTEHNKGDLYNILQLLRSLIPRR